MVEPLRADDELMRREITFRRGGEAVDAIAGYLDGGADVVIVRRAEGEPLMVPSSHLWRRISALLKADPQGPERGA
jgi:hypothetical protein